MTARGPACSCEVTIIERQDWNSDFNLRCSINAVLSLASEALQSHIMRNERALRLHDE